MKKAFLILGYTLFTFITVLMLFVLIFSRLGYTVTLFSNTAVALLTAVITAAETVLSLFIKERNCSKLISVLFSLSAPLLIINWIFYLSDISVITVICMLICLGCCCYLTIRYGKPLVLKIIGLVISALLISPVCLFTFFALMDFGQNTVVKTLPSPNDTYYAEVIDSDQGALGGNTVVNICENFEFNAVVFKITKPPKLIYSGKWGEYENMEIYWKNEHILVINSVEYTVE